MISPTSFMPQQQQFPSMLQGILPAGMMGGSPLGGATFGPSTLTANPFGPTGGFPPVGTFQGIGSQRVLSQLAATSSALPGMPAGFMVGGPNIGGFPVGGGQFTGFAQPAQLGAGQFGMMPGMGAGLGMPMGFGTAMPASFGSAMPMGIGMPSMGVPSMGMPTGFGMGMPSMGMPAFAIAMPTMGAPANPFSGQLGMMPGLGMPAMGAGIPSMGMAMPALAAPIASPMASPALQQPPQQNLFAQQPAPAPTSQPGGGMSQILPMLMQIMSMMMSLLTQIMGGQPPQTQPPGGAPGGTPGYGGTPSYGTGGGGTAANTPPASYGGAGSAAYSIDQAPSGGITNQTANPAQRAELDQSLEAIASDPEGARLLEAARAKGVTIEVGDPAAAADGAQDVGSKSCDCGSCHEVAADGTTVVNGVTLSGGNGPTRIVVRDPSNVKTLVHELVHAVSTEDGNSRQEEGIADVIGSRVANRIGGAGGLTGSEQEIFLNKQQFYPDLNQNNDIRQTLASLGLSVNV